MVVVRPSANIKPMSHISLLVKESYFMCANACEITQSLYALLLSLQENLWNNDGITDGQVIVGDHRRFDVEKVCPHVLSRAPIDYDIDGGRSVDDYLKKN